MSVANGCVDGAPADRTAALRGAEYPELFAYSETPDAAGLLACFGVGSSVVGTIDTGKQMAAFTTTDRPDPSVVWTPEVIFVRSDLVVRDPSTEWLSIQRRDAATPIAVEIADILDDSLARLAFAPSLPPTASDVIDAVFVAEPTITSTTNASGAGVVRATIDGPALDDVELEVPATSGRGLVVEITIGAADRVAQIYSTTLRPDGSDDPDALGLTVAFDWSPPPTELREPASHTVTPVASLDPATVRRPPDIACAVGA